MPLIETIKEKVERITGWGRPTRRDVQAALRLRKPNVFRFTDDGLIPNNGKLPLIFYRGVVRTADVPDPAALFEVLFESNGWKSSWRDGIFDCVHYHSQIHEVLGIAHGTRWSASADPEVASSSSRRVTLRSCRREQGTSDSTKGMISWSSVHIRHLENTIYAASRRRSTIAP